MSIVGLHIRRMRLGFSLSFCGFDLRSSLLTFGSVSKLSLLSLTRSLEVLEILNGEVLDVS